MCEVVQSRMGVLTGLYHVSQVFHMTSSQLSYSHMLDENYRTALISYSDVLFTVVTTLQ